MKKTVLGVVLVVVTLATVHAKTVAWYHFDEGVIGSVANGNVILNSVDTNSLKATGYSSWGSGGVYPVYTNAFPSGVACYDPVSGQVVDNGKSLWFLNENRVTAWTGARSIVKIDDEDSILLKTFTVECFLKYAEDLLDVTTISYPWLNLFTKFTGPSPAWGTDPELTYKVFIDGKDAINFTVKTITTENGSVTTNIYTGSYTTKGLLNGRWHHFAVSFDDSIKKAKLFYDYKQVSEIEYAGDLIYPETKNGTLHIGSNHGNACAWNGRIDEFRISDEALTVDKFLRYDGAPVDSETVCHIRFSCPQDFGVEDLPSAVANTIRGSFVTTAPASGNFKKGISTLVLDASSAMLRPDICTPHVNNNVGSLYMSPSSPTSFSGDCVFVDDTVDGRHAVLANSWTMEFIVKVPPHGYDGAVYLLSLMQNNGLGTFYMPLGKNRTLSAGFTTVSGDGSFNGVNDFCNDQWHHVAITYDRPSLTCSLFVDYVLKQKKEFDYKTNGTEGDNASYGNGICLGNGWAPWHATTNYFDEFRLTTRALTPQEFLTSNPYVEVPYVAYVDFEGDSSVQPYDTVTPAGVTTGAFLTTSVGSRWLADEEGHQGRHNAGTMKIDDVQGKVVFGRNIMLENLEEQTIEFFMKADEGADGDNVVCLSRTDGMGAPRFWGISLSGNSIAVYADTAAASNQGGKLGNVDVVGGKWHHVAVTFAKKGESQTDVTVWIDYVQQSTTTIEGTLKAADFTTSTLTFGGSSFKGAIDEFKVSPTILPQEKFMRFYFDGTILIVR